MAEPLRLPQEPISPFILDQAVLELKAGWTGPAPTFAAPETQIRKRMRFQAWNIVWPSERLFLPGEVYIEKIPGTALFAR